MALTNTINISYWDLFVIWLELKPESLILIYIYSALRPVALPLPCLSFQLESTCEAFGYDVVAESITTI